MKLNAVTTVFFVLISSNTAQAGAMGEVNTSPWNFEFGSRYWLSANSYTATLYGDPSEPPVSRLSYDSATGNSAEGFWQLMHNSGLFIKGYLGGGSIANGSMYNEDFPPLTRPYSETYQRQKNGMLHYLSTDLGYHLFSAANWKLGVFLGYHYWVEHLNTFGCIQTANNQEICGTLPAEQIEPISDATDNINNKSNWSSLRIGITGLVQLTPQAQLVADIAYVRSHLNSVDYHNLRPDIRGIPEDGTGNGVQMDGLLNWMMNPNWSLGAGVRWWHIETRGHAHFEETALGGQLQRLDVTSDSYGLLIQTNYQFDNTIQKYSISPASWAGSYIGLNIGYGTNPQTATIYPTSISASNLQNSEQRSPKGLHLQNSGFLGGGQLGYNWRINKIMIGAETDIGYTHVSGANGVTLLENNTTIENNLRWLATLRGRLGTLATNNMMVFLTAGPAFGNVNLSFAQKLSFFNCPGGICSTGTNSNNKTGWTAGAGVEYSVSEQSSFKAEYLYVDLGSLSVNSIDSSPLNVTYLITQPFNANIIRMGVNYKIA